MSLLEHINYQGKIISIETILRSSGIKYILESPRLIMVWSQYGIRDRIKQDQIEDRIQLVSFLSRKSNCLVIGWFDEDHPVRMGHNVDHPQRIIRPNQNNEIQYEAIKDIAEEFWQDSAIGNCFKNFTLP